MTPLTSSEKQSRRIAELDAIAQAAGWATWTRYATAVKRGVVSIENNPTGENEMNSLDFLDCIAHGTTREDFLKSFRGANKAARAAKHLRKFYIENGGDADKTQLDEAERKARRYFESL